MEEVNEAKITIYINTNKNTYTKTFPFYLSEYEEVIKGIEEYLKQYYTYIYGNR